VVDFPGEGDNLHSYNLCNQAGFLFVSVKPLAPFEQFIDRSANKLKMLDANG
jgi:hypothetical protein